MTMTIRNKQSRVHLLLTLLGNGILQHHKVIGNDYLYYKNGDYIRARHIKVFSNISHLYENSKQIIETAKIRIEFTPYYNLMRRNPKYRFIQIRTSLHPDSPQKAKFFAFRSPLEINVACGEHNFLQEENRFSFLNGKHRNHGR